MSFEDLIEVDVALAQLVRMGHIEHSFDENGEDCFKITKMGIEHTEKMLGLV